ncbi:hypothetical protein QRD89_18685 [Halobacillus sp. ACCC02827]|uniref:hypothetical protein n=1 Tax=Bacillaceae TaxID=186817 RepID=UPI0002A4F013|nr:MULTISPECIES: hypothetical protein [Bacillaceae]ELK47833.1 hypothetical protein D479_05065 [Halobacillus sp. BAB-2008]QHT48484.1 hypothetical protein M662_19005 [Bacillus sp. SB49]WJE15723.1 hypothetical protein QRD89_18685 [Halobacillus sp. ACCC02827]
MTYEEAVKVLKTIKDFYPDKFQLTENTIAMLVPEIEKMEYVPVMKRLTAYVWENPFPPRLVDIASYPEEVEDQLEEERKWAQEAAAVSMETKRKFEEAMKNLMRKVTQDVYK